MVSNTDTTPSDDLGLAGLALGGLDESLALPSGGESLAGVFGLDGFSDAAVGGLVVPVPGQSVAFGDSTVMLWSVDGLCLGSIGQGSTKFCCASGDRCSVASHKRNKDSSVEPGLYILSHGTTAFCRPYVPSSKLNDGVICDMLGRTLSFAEARDELTILCAATVTSVKVKDEMKEDMKRALSFKTPFKTKRSEGLTDDGRFPWEVEDDGDMIKDDFTSLVRKNLETKTDEFPLSDTKVSDPGVKILITQLSEAILAIDHLLRDQAVQMDKAAWDLSVKMSSADAALVQIKQLQGVVGNPNTTLISGGIEPVVWEAIASLFGRVAESDVKIKSFGEALSNSNVEQFKTDVGKILASYRDRIVTLSTKVKDLDSVIALQKDQRLPKRLKTSSQAGILDDLKFMDLDSSGTKAATQTTTSSRVNGPEPNNVIASSSTDTSIVESLSTRLKDVEHLIHAFTKTKSEMDSVRIGNATFTCQKDVEKWYGEHINGLDKMPRYGLFVCPMILLQWVYCRIVGTAAGQTKILNLKKLEVEEPELRAIESLGIVVPWVFSGKTDNALKNTGGLDKARFSNAASFANWEDPAMDTGLKEMIEDNLDDVESAISSQIDDTFEGYPVVQSLAKDMLNISYNFIKHLTQYMSHTFTQFKKQDVGSDKVIWNLITYVVSNLFSKDFAKKRNLAIGAVTSVNKYGGFKVMWCTWRSVGLAKRLSNTGIKDTPAVSASYVRFVLTQSNMGKVGALVEQNKKLQSSVAKLEEELKSLKKLVKEAKSTADAAMSKASKGSNNKRKGEDGSNKN